MKNFIKNRLNLLLEGMTDVVYHFTHISSLQNILDEDKFNISTNIGSPADLNTSKGKFFFFSTTRSKKSGFTKGNVKIVLNGQKLNQRYKSFPMDYWNYSTNPKDWGDVENNPRDRAAYKQALQSKELEDRIVTDKPTIDNASKYILALHVLLDDYTTSYTKKSSIIHMINTAKEKNLPMYFYDNKENWLNQTQPIDPLSIQTYRDEAEEEYKNSSRLNMGRVLALMAYKDDTNKTQIIQDFAKDDKFTAWLDDQLERDTYNYLRYPDKFSMSEYKSVVGAEIHNQRTNPDSDTRKVFMMLARDMKKLGAKDLTDYIEIKTGQKKPVSAPDKLQPILMDTEVNREVPWDKTAWFYLDQETLWNMLPENLKQDTRFVALINKKDAHMDYVYGFLVKNTNKNLARAIFKTAGLEVVMK